MKIRAAENDLQALMDRDCAFARFLPTIYYAPGYIRQGKSSIGAGIWRRPHPPNPDCAAAFSSSGEWLWKILSLS